MEKKNNLPAYLVASSFMPEGHDSINAYGEAAHVLFEKAGAEIVVAGSTEQQINILEGEWKPNARFTLFKFPSMDALMELWNSEEYQNIKHLRTDAIPPNFTFAVEGFDPSYFDKLK